MTRMYLKRKKIKRINSIHSNDDWWTIGIRMIPYDPLFIWIGVDVPLSWIIKEYTRFCLFCISSNRWESTSMMMSSGFGKCTPAVPPNHWNVHTLVIYNNFAYTDVTDTCQNHFILFCWNETLFGRDSQSFLYKNNSSEKNRRYNKLNSFQLLIKTIKLNRLWYSYHHSFVSISNAIK